VTVFFTMFHVPTRSFAVCALATPGPANAIARAAVPMADVLFVVLPFERESRHASVLLRSSDFLMEHV
jgi:hypothetical protein